MAPPFRSSVVCTACHSRKVKCDLQTSHDGVCQNCRRFKQSCIRRDNIRKRRVVSQSQSTHSSPPGIIPQHQASITDTAQPVWPGHVSPGATGDAATSPQQSDQSITKSCFTGLPYESVNYEPRYTSLGNQRPTEAAALKSTPADVLPRPALLRAWTDAYADNAFHHCPVVETSDLSNPGSSILLGTALCLIGNIARQSPSSPGNAAAMYEKFKTLLLLDCEPDQVRQLKAICLASYWVPSDAGSLNGTWHWLGVATRLALQMGLHRETTYENRLDASCRRRIFWFLHNNDALQTAFWGRPPLLRRGEYDTKPPSQDDFENPGLGTLIFIESCKLCKIMAQNSEFVIQGRKATGEMPQNDTALIEWITQLPPALQLYDSEWRKAYYRPSSELMLQYLVTIIMNHMPRQAENGRLRPPSSLVLAAASCAVYLYDEISCRDDAVSLLSIHGFFCLAAALPLICHRPRSPAGQAARREKIDVVRSIVSGMREKYGDADLVLAKIDGLQKKADEWSYLNGQLPTETSPMGMEPLVEMSLLLPFPTDIRDEIRLLDMPDPHEDTSDVVDSHAFQLTDGIGDMMFDYSLMDFFDFEFAEPGDPNGNEGGLQTNP